jgi:hypothetical protein
VTVWAVAPDSKLSEILLRAQLLKATMSSGKHSNSTQNRRPLQPMRSFTRMETSNTDSLPRIKTPAMQSSSTSELDPKLVPDTTEKSYESRRLDLFETPESNESDPNATSTPPEQQFAQFQTLDTAADELPVELASLTDRYLTCTITLSYLR